MTSALRPAAQAFDAIAPAFDQRFGTWLSVMAQRRAVRAALLQEFPENGHILELGGGTGEDASFLAGVGYQVLLTDPSPTMVELAKSKLSPLGSHAQLVAGEDLEDFAVRRLSEGGEPFDGAFSNFAPLNLYRQPSTCSARTCEAAQAWCSGHACTVRNHLPAEMLTEVLHNRPSQVLRRFKRGQISARLSKCEFPIVYHGGSALTRSFTPWFVLEKRIGIGVTVPPSAAEPWISQHPRLLAAMEALDRVLSRPLAMLGDHVLYQFRRTAAL